MTSVYSFFLIFLAIALHVAAIVANGFGRKGSPLSTIVTGYTIVPANASASDKNDGSHDAAEIWRQIAAVIRRHMSKT